MKNNRQTKQPRAWKSKEQRRESKKQKSSLKPGKEPEERR